MKINQLYFASLKEQLGVANEKLDLPNSVRCIADLKCWIIDQDETRAAIWETQNLLVSVNQNMAKADTVIADGDEIAWFPPVTGG